MRRFIENSFSKLEHLSLNIGYSAGTMPTKLPNNLKSFSLRTHDLFSADSSNLLSIIARDCKNLKCLYLEIGSLLPNMIVAIGNIKRYKNWKIILKSTLF